ncbi:MAG: bacteriocin [Ktedonobacteraceae bacterium]|nr:bacteriocin [Ktedonobacteraceae bacterium]
MKDLRNDFFDTNNQQITDERQAIELNEKELEQVNGGCHHHRHHCHHHCYRPCYYYYYYYDCYDYCGCGCCW